MVSVSPGGPAHCARPGGGAENGERIDAGMAPEALILDATVARTARARWHPAARAGAIAVGRDQFEQRVAMAIVHGDWRAVSTTAQVGTGARASRS